jgi:hypothetical protein
MSKKPSKLMSKHSLKKGNNSAETSDDDHSHSGRGSSNSSAIYSDSGNSSAGQNQTAISNGSTNTSIGGIALSPAGPLSLNYGYLPFPCYRRMTPEEDLLATQQGIDILVKQRQALVDQLVKHHDQLARTNEKESLLQFSRQIDTIMRMRGFSIMPSPNPAKFHRVKQLQHKESGNKIERGVTFDQII